MRLIIDTKPKVTGFAGYFLIIILIGITFSDKLGGFTLGLVVLTGAGISFAMQEVIASDIYIDLGIANKESEDTVL